MSLPTNAILERPSWFALQFELRALEEGSIPRFLGPVFHGAFGHALRESCVQLPQAIPLYDLCYERNSTSSPNRTQPFLFDVHRDCGGNMRCGDGIRAQWIGKPILASAPAFLPALLYSLKIMAANGLGPDLVPFELIAVRILPHPIFRPDDSGINILPAVYTFTDLQKPSDSERAEIKLETPTQLVSKNRILKSVDGPIFFRRLWQRIAAWGEFELCSQIKPPFFDEIGVKCDETHWQLAERWSSRQQKRLDVSGLVGRVTFSGLDNFAWGLLRIGEQLHVGKNTTCGLGKYFIMEK
jgi:hypothetical protein